MRPQLIAAAEIDRVETWTGKLPQRDWATLETGWANAYTGR